METNTAPTKITETTVRLYNHNSNIKAFVDIILNDCWVIRGIVIIEARDADGQKKLIIRMPHKTTKNGKARDMAHPIHAEAFKQAYDTIMKDYYLAIEENKEQAHCHGLSDEELNQEVPEDNKFNK